MYKLLVLGLFALVPANAASITFDFIHDGGDNSSNTYGNTRTYTSGGLTVVVTSFGATGGGGTMQTAFTGFYDGNGLGVCNRGENCEDPQHQLDNSGADDFTIFSFSGVVDPLSITVRPFGDNESDGFPDFCSGDCADADITYWLRTTNSALSIAGETTTGFVTNEGFLSPLNPADVPDGTAAVTHLLGGSTTVCHMIIAGRQGSSDDFFKIQSLTVNYEPQSDEPVPEPATLFLIGSALIALGRAHRSHNS